MHSRQPPPKPNSKPAQAAVCGSATALSVIKKNINEAPDLEICVANNCNNLFNVFEMVVCASR